MNILGCLDKATSGTYRVPVRMLPRWTPMRWRNCAASIRLYFPALPFAFAFNRRAEREVPAVYAGLERKQRLLRAQDCCNGWGWKTVQSIIRHSFRGSATARQHRAGIDERRSGNSADEPTGALDSHSGEEVMAILISCAIAGIR